MATWTDIDDARLEPGKPIRSVDGLALRDNPIAIVEGAAGAPRIQEPAMANNSVANRALVNGAVTATKMAVTSSETAWVLGRNSGAAAAAVGSYAMLKNLTASIVSPGSTFAGSSLRWSSAAGDISSSPGGSWRCMGYANGNNGAQGVTLLLRYA